MIFGALKGVRTQHPDYAKYLPQWKRIRDVIAGQDAVKAQGVAYLPKLVDQTQIDYSAYLGRALFYNASWRTVSGLIGMMFRKPPNKDVPKGIEDFLKDIDMSGTDFDTFAKKVATEGLSISRGGLLVDFPTVAPSEGYTPTLADAAKNGLRPMIQIYCAESIINWKTRRIANRTLLSLVVLTEDYEIPSADEFGKQIETRYRVLDLDPANDFYRVRVYRIDDKGADQLVSQVYPQMDNALLTEIPFYFFGLDDTSPNVDESAIIDLVDANIKHFQVSADLAHGTHFTALPTPVVTGYETPVPTDGKQLPTEKLYVGSQSAWLIPNDKAKAYYLEFQGTGLQAVEKYLDRIEEFIALLGARMLAAEKKDSEAAETAAIHRTGENSVLSAIAISVSKALTNALTMFSKWAGQAEEPTFEINREFLPFVIDAPELQALVKAWQGGAFDLEDLFELYKRADMVDGEKTFEEFKTGLEANAPPPPPAPPLNPNTNNPETGLPHPKPAPTGGAA